MTILKLKIFIGVLLLVTSTRSIQFEYYLGPEAPPSNILDSQDASSLNIDTNLAIDGEYVFTMDKAVKKFNISGQGQPYFLKVTILNKGATHTLLVTSGMGSTPGYAISGTKLTVSADQFDRDGAEFMENVLVIKPEVFN
jgi:hypothetical protein